MRREESIEKRIFQGTMEGCRGRGHPVTPWADNIKRLAGGSLAVASNKAKDREGWRTLVKATLLQRDLIDMNRRVQDLYIQYHRTLTIENL